MEPDAENLLRQQGREPLIGRGSYYLLGRLAEKRLGNLDKPNILTELTSGVCGEKLRRLVSRKNRVPVASEGDYLSNRSGHGVWLSGE